MPQQHEAARAALPRKVAFALGLGSLAGFFGYTGVSSLAIPVYQMTLGVHPVLLGVALAVPRFWEAFIDPLMGNFSDNFRSRWGRRRPFIVVGSIVMGLLYGLIWQVSPQWSEHTKVVYFTVMSAGFFTAYMMFSVPYASLTYEITPDYNERTRVMGYCALFHKLGEFGYQWVFPLSQLAIFASALVGIRIVGWGVGMVILAGCGMIPGLFVRERFQHVAERQPRVGFWQSVHASFRHQAFRVLVGLTLLNVVMGMLASNLDHYLIVYYMFHGDIATGSTWKGLLSSGYAVVGFATIPLVVWGSARLGKRNALAVIYGLTAIGGVAKWFVFSPQHPWLLFLDPLLCGPIWVAVNMLLSSMLADICDEDELLCGQRREGTFGAIFSWMQKTAVSLSFLGASIALTLVGFDQKLGGAQSMETLRAMRFVLAGSTAIPPIIALVLLRSYKLTAQRAAATRRELEERRASIAAEPALSG